MKNTNNPTQGIGSPLKQKQKPQNSGETFPHFVLPEHLLLKPIDLTFFGVGHSQLRRQECCQRLPARCQNRGGNSSILHGAHYQKQLLDR